MVDATWLSYLVFLIGGYFVLLFVLMLSRGRLRRRHSLTARDDLFFVMIVPARNEAAVIGDTLKSLLAVKYPNRLVLVMNDASTDGTSQAARAFETTDVVRVIDRDPAVAGHGKGAVLNHAFRLVTDMLLTDSRLAGFPPDRVVIGIMDADGRLDELALRNVAAHFTDGVAGVQIGVRISNAHDNLLARMQDIEFVGFSGLVQEARDGLGSVGLGGNGQFTRLSALVQLGCDPWTQCLTEDLDLGLTLVESGWRIRFCPDTYVAQQGLVRIRPLLRQRTRWVQGHYQCWRHLPRLWSAKDVPTRTRIDLTLYLLYVTVVVFLSIGVTLSLLSLFGVVSLANHSLNAIPAGSPRNAALEAISIGPLLVFLAAYQRRSSSPLQWWELPTYALGFSLYCYIFLVSQARAWCRMALRRGNWEKTSRIAEPGRPAKAPI